MRSGVAVTVHAVQDDDVYYLEVELGEARMRLLNSRGSFRTFSSLDTVANLVAGLGAEEFKTTVVPATVLRGR